MSSQLDLQIPDKGRAALTVFELLVLLAAVAIAVALLGLPVFRRKPYTMSAHCMNCTKQLAVAWLTYPADNQDQLMPNPGWVAGTMDRNPANPDNTNKDQLTNPAKSSMADYIKSGDLFECPGDNFTSWHFNFKRVRSYSLNAALAGTNVGGPMVHGGKNYYGTDATGTNQPAQKTSDLNMPGPAMIFTIVCEHPDSVNDGAFVFEPGYAPGSERWVDLPSSHHLGPSCSLAYVDGHAERHKWQEVGGTNTTDYPVTVTTNRPWAARPVGTSRDYEWMEDRMPYR